MVKWIETNIFKNLRLIVLATVALGLAGGFQADLIASGRFLLWGDFQTTEKTTPATADRLIIYDSEDAGNVKYVTRSNWLAGAGGESNTASNAGSGASVYYQKSGVDLQFNAIKSENTAISVAVDGTSHDVELTFNSGNVKLDDLGAADDNTDLNASSSAHGLMPKLSNNAYDRMSGTGTWASIMQLKERSSDPGDPAEGENVIWQSDGTGTGDDGDIIMKVTAGAVTKTTTILDFSIAQ
jgi:hypothetical protein